MDDPTMNDGFRQRYLDALKFLQQTQAPMGPEPVEPTAPKETFLQNAAGPMATVLGNIRPARLPGAGHQAANILSALAQIYGGAQQNMLEQKRKDYSTQAAQYRADMAERRKQQMAGPEALRLDMAKRIAEGPKAEPAMVDVPGVGKVPATSEIAKEYLYSTGKLKKPVSPVDPELQRGRELLNQEREFRMEEAQRARDAEEADIEDKANAIANFRTDPIQALQGRDIKFRTKVENRVNRLLAESGSKYSLRQLQQLRQEADRFSRTMNTPRPTQLRQSAVTVYEHLDQMENFYNKYWPQAESFIRNNPVARFIPLPKELKESNKAVLWLAQNGWLGPQASEDANALVATGDPVRRESELVFSSGYAPYEQEIRNGFKKLDEARGPRGFAGQMRAIRSMIRKRVEVATKAIPFYGGEDNPYLLGVSPIGAWLEKEKESGAMKPSTPAANRTEAPSREDEAKRLDREFN